MISFKMDFDEEQFKKSLTDAAVTAAQEGIQRKVAAVRCPVHGEHARAEFINQSGSQLEYKIQACCEPAVESAKAALIDK
jgi:hypothetical protein